MALQKNIRSNRVTIVGAGTSGYLTALYLCTKFTDTHVTWIYPETNNPIGVGEATVPEVQEFLSDLGLDIREILTSVNGNLKLGIKFENFNRPNGHFFHPFGTSDTESLEIEYMMSNNRIPDDILGYTDIASHFDVRELMSYLDARLSMFSNLTIIRKSVESLDEVSDDFVIDCTGFKKAFIDVPDNFVPLNIPNNRALVYRAEYTDPLFQQMPYTTCHALSHGWCWNIPLKDKISFGYVHDDQYDVRAEFIQYVESKMHVKIDESLIASVPMITGRNKQHIVQQGDKTVCAVGLSSFFIEPLESTGLYLVVFGIKTLARYLTGEIEATDYDATYNNEFDIILDFILAHYKYSENSNEYWDVYKDLPIQAHRSNNIFPQRSWNFVLAGMGVQPRNDKITATSILKLRNGVTYNKWVENAKYTA